MIEIFNLILGVLLVLGGAFGFGVFACRQVDEMRAARRESAKCILRDGRECLRLMKQIEHDLERREAA